MMAASAGRAAGDDQKRPVARTEGRDTDRRKEAKSRRTTAIHPEGTSERARTGFAETV